MVNPESMVAERNQNQKATILNNFTYILEVKNRQIHRDIEYVSGGQGLGWEGNRE